MFCCKKAVVKNRDFSHEKSRQEYWSGLPCPLPGDLPHPGIEPSFPALQVDWLPLSHQASPNTFLRTLNNGNAMCILPQ